MSITTVAPVFDSSLFIPELRTRRKESVLNELVQRARLAGAVRDADSLLELLMLRERLGSTALGKGVAVPNARSLAVVEPRLLVARSRRGLEWDAPDGLPVSLVLLTLSPSELSDEAHHGFVARAVGLSRLQRNRQRLLEAESVDAVATLVREVAP